jgi:hypothetical protein
MSGDGIKVIEKKEKRGEDLVIDKLKVEILELKNLGFSSSRGLQIFW